MTTGGVVLSLDGPTGVVRERRDRRSDGQVDPAALTSAVQHIFLAVVVIAVLMLVTALALPRQPPPEPA